MKMLCDANSDKQCDSLVHIVFKIPNFDGKNIKFLVWIYTIFWNGSYILGARRKNIIFTDALWECKHPGA